MTDNIIYIFFSYSKAEYFSENLKVYKNQISNEKLILAIDTYLKFILTEWSGILGTLQNVKTLCSG